MRGGVLVVEDETRLARNIRRSLTDDGYAAQVSCNADDAIRAFIQFRPDAVILDYCVPGADGLTLLERILALDSTATVLLVTGQGSTEIAVTAMKRGAADYLGKPLSLAELKLRLSNALTARRAERGVSALSTGETAALAAIKGNCSAIAQLRLRIQRLAGAERAIRVGTVPPSVLITGETGSGKGLIARALHAEGPRHDGPFIELNCAALPEHLVEAEIFGYEKGAFTDAKVSKIGLAEAAEGGTLFLDEIGEASAGFQAKLLTLIESRTVRRIGSVRDRPVNVRIIAATNRDLARCVEQESFRADLFYRLGIVRFEVPALRDRVEDIPVLCDALMGEIENRYGRQPLHLTQEALDTLCAYGWPGNVRQLANVLEQAVLFSDGKIAAEELSLSAQMGAPKSASFELPANGLDLSCLERSLIEQAVDRASGNVRRAAELLGLSRDTLRYRIEKHGVSARAPQENLT